MSDLALPRPNNLRLRSGEKLSLVESDVYNVCNRIKEIDPNLTVLLHDGHPEPWVVMELGPDGVERFVCRRAELEPSILDHLRYIRAVPFEDRLRKLEKEEQEANARMGKDYDDEQFAHMFHQEMVKANMVDPKWGRSYRLKPRG